MRLAITLLLAAVVATGCAAHTTSSGVPAATTGSSAKAGKPVDACEFFTQADAESMLGQPTGPAKNESASPVGSTCAYHPSGAATPGTRVALSIGFGEFSGTGTLSDFKDGWPDAVDVTGFPYPAMRNANGTNFAMQGNDRGCGLIMSIKKPADPDAFARQVGAICAKALAS